MDKKHAERLAAMGCVCCELLDMEQVSETNIHHVREGQGLAQRAGDFLTIPLCRECHQGKNGVHGNRQYLKMLRMTELDLLNYTLKRAFNDLRH